MTSKSKTTTGKFVATLNAIDSFAKPIFLTLNKQDKYTTGIGGFVTLIKYLLIYSFFIY